MDENVEQKIKELTGAVSVVEKEVIQTLWSGYGSIVRLALTGGSVNSVILKNIDLSAVSNHPRGWNTEISHERKVKSYEVEMDWYSNWNTNETEDFRTANCLLTSSNKNNHFIVMEDLDLSGYPLRKQHLDLSEVKSCVKWLANFHGFHLNKKPTGLWQEGTYWNLNTRPDEFLAMKDGPLKDNASKIDQILLECSFQTIVHGDAKVANFCFSDTGNKVAVVDFQYVGGGCGMKDLIYFLGSCLDENECEMYEERILQYYFKELNAALIKYGKDIDFDVLEKEWRALYAFAWADFTRFLLGWMPTHTKLNMYSNKMKHEALNRLNP